MSYENIRIENQSLSLFDPDYTIKKLRLEYIRNRIGLKHETILDYGCGNSPYEKYFNAKRFIKADVQQNKGNNVDIIIENNKLSLEDDSVDLVLLSDVLEHVLDYQTAIAEIYRVLRPNGILFVSVPFIYREHEAPYDFFRYTTYSIPRILKQFGKVEFERSGNQFFTIMSLAYESSVRSMEITKTSFFGRVIRKIYRMTLLPIFNLWCFSIPSRIDDQIFHHILVKAVK